MTSEVLASSEDQSGISSPLKIAVIRSVSLLNVLSYIPLASSSSVGFFGDQECISALIDVSHSFFESY